MNDKTIKTFNATGTAFIVEILGLKVLLTCAHNLYHVNSDKKWLKAEEIEFTIFDLDKKQVFNSLINIDESIVYPSYENDSLYYYKE